MTTVSTLSHTYPAASKSTNQMLTSSQRDQAMDDNFSELLEEFHSRQRNIGELLHGTAAELNDVNVIDSHFDIHFEKTDSGSLSPHMPGMVKRNSKRSFKSPTLTIHTENVGVPAVELKDGATDVFTPFTATTSVGNTPNTAISMNHALNLPSPELTLSPGTLSHFQTFSPYKVIASHDSSPSSAGSASSTASGSNRLKPGPQNGYCHAGQLKCSPFKGETESRKKGSEPATPLHGNSASPPLPVAMNKDEVEQAMAKVLSSVRSSLSLMEGDFDSSSPFVVLDDEDESYLVKKKLQFQQEVG